MAVVALERGEERTWERWMAHVGGCRRCELARRAGRLLDGSALCEAGAALLQAWDRADQRIADALHRWAVA